MVAISGELVKNRLLRRRPESCPLPAASPTPPSRARACSRGSPSVSNSERDGADLTGRIHHGDAVAESVNGVDKWELIRRQGP